MKQDRLLFGLIGIIIGLVAGILISRYSSSPSGAVTPRQPMIESQKAPTSQQQMPAIEKKPELPSPSASPQAQQAPKLPKGHPPVDGQSVQQQIISLEEKVKKDPQNQTALVALGNLNADSGNMPKAAEWYEKAVENDPNNVGLISDLGTCYLQMQNFDKAFELYRRSLSIDPNHFQTLVNLSIYYMATGEKNKAAETLEKVVTLYPNDPRAEMFKKAIQEIRTGKK